MSEPVKPDMAGLIVWANSQFEEMVQNRHEMGGLKYGPVAFMDIDSLEMALEEIADLANYARYTWIKLKLLQVSVSKLPEVLDSEEPVNLGKDAVSNPFIRKG
jgi:hypothetical protein